MYLVTTLFHLLIGKVEILRALQKFVISRLLSLVHFIEWVLFGVRGHANLYSCLNAPPEIQSWTDVQPECTLLWAQIWVFAGNVSWEQGDSVRGVLAWIWVCTLPLESGGTFDLEHDSGSPGIEFFRTDLDMKIVNHQDNQKISRIFYVENSLLKSL